MWSKAIHQSLWYCPAVDSKINCGAPKATAAPHLALPTRAAPLPPESEDHISLFLSVHVRIVRLIQKVLLSGQLWNIFTLIYSSEVHLPRLIIDLHSSSLVKARRSSHRSESHATWHAERGKSTASKLLSVSGINYMRVTELSYWGSRTRGLYHWELLQHFPPPRKELPRDFNSNQKLLNC